MKSRIIHQHFIDVLFCLGLLCVFAASAFGVIVIGADIYQNTVSGMNSNYTTRTSLSYIGEKLRQYDTSQAISLGQIEDKDALLLKETINGQEYVTYIYEDGGTLKELFSRSVLSPQKNQGTAILEVHNFSMEDEGNGFYRFTVSDRKENDLSLLLYVRSE